MKILVGRLKDLWPELTVPMSIPKKIDESKEKLLGNLPPHRSIDNNGAPTTFVGAGNPERNQQQTTSNNNEESRKDSEDDDEDEDEEGICVVCVLSQLKVAINNSIKEKLI